MRIYRDQSRLSFRRQRRRRSGCFSLVVLVGLVIGALALSWSWLGERLHFTSRPVIDDATAQAMRAFEEGDLDAAVGHARRALETNPDDGQALILLVRALVYRSYTDYNRAVDRSTALEIAEQARQRSEGPLTLAVHAYALQAAGDPVEAAKTAAQVLETDPNNALAHVANSLAYGSVGSFNIALRESQQAALNPDFQIDGFRAMAISYSDLGDYKTAIQTVERAISLNRHLIPLYFERALYALQIGDTDAATAAYYQILTYAPDNVKVRLRLCELSSLLRKHDSAVKYCQEVTRRAPDWSDGWYQLGMEHFLQGDFPNAEDALHRCSTLQVLQGVPVTQRRFQCWYLQGQAAEILGDCENLTTIYNEFRAMAAEAPIQQTWLYPPEGPPGCPAGMLQSATPAS